MNTAIAVQEHFVPSYTKGHERPIKFGVIHFVSAKNMEGYEQDPYNMEGVLKIFDEEGPKYQFSCHYIIDREGNIWQLVRLEDTAWHAGKSVIAIPEYMENINHDSIGVELVCKAGDKYTTPQYQSLANLAVFIEDYVNNQNLGHIEQWVGHDWISGQIAVDLGIKKKSVMKVDPGTLFDWDVFLREKYRVRLENEVRATAKHDFKHEILKELSVKECFSLAVSKLLKRKSN